MSNPHPHKQQNEEESGEQFCLRFFTKPIKLLGLANNLLPTRGHNVIMVAMSYYKKVCFD